MATEGNVHADDAGTKQKSDSGGSDSGSLPLLTLRVLVFALVVGTLGLALLLLCSALVVFATGLAARWFHLPELHLFLAVVSILALTVITVVATRLASAISALGRQLDSRIEDARHSIVDECTHLVDVLAEAPVMVLEAGHRSPRVAATKRNRRSP